MKKLFLISILFIVLLIPVKRSEAQGRTDTIGAAAQQLTTIYNNMHGTSITDMSNVCQYYTITVQSTLDTLIKVGFDAAFVGKMKTHSGENYIGTFKASNQTDMWYKKWNAETTTGEWTIKIINIVR